MFKLLLLLILLQSIQAKVIYVKASRVDMESSEVTSTYDEIKIEDDLESELPQTEGLFISEQGAFAGASTLKLRGTERGFSKIFLDDIELTDPTDINRSFQINLLNNFGVSNALVLKGPQSVHFGSDAVGGIVRLQTKLKQKRPVELSLGLGSNDFREYGVKFIKKSKKIKLKIISNYTSTDGLSSYSKGQERDFFKKFNFYGVTEAKISNKDTFKYSFLMINSNADIDNYTADIIHNDRSRYDQTTHQVKYSRRSFNDRLKSDLKISRTNIFRDTQGDNPSELSGKTEKIEWFHHLYLNSVFTPSLLVEYNKETATNLSEFTSFDSRTLEYASVSLGLKSHFDNFVVDSGLKYLKHTTFSNLYALNIGIKYLMNKNTSFFTNASRNYVLPTVFQTYYGRGEPALEATTGKSVDLGLERAFGRLKFNIALFNNEFENQIDYDQSNNKYNNIKRSYVRGIESKISFFYKKLKTTLGGSVHRSVVKDTGAYIGKSPRLMSFLNVEYTIADEFLVKSNWRYVGERNDFGRMPSHLVGDFFLSYRMFNLSLRNVLDKDYENSRNYSTLGRTLFFNVKYEI